jgi:cysteine desulfurase
VIYLDHNASAPCSDAARAAVTDLLADGWANPSSIHLRGQRARAVIENARERVAEAIGAEPGEIVFCSGATEANNLAWQGAWRAWAQAAANNGSAQQQGIALTTAVEHPSVLAAAKACGWRTDVVGVDAHGTLLEDALQQALQAEPAFASIMAVNNETGVVFPVAEIAEKARIHGTIVHCDATQAMGRLPVDVGALGVDLLSLSGHKIGALPGVGALFVRRGTALRAVIGGHQEDGLRGGTENIVGIASLGAAAATQINRIADQPRQRALRDDLWARLQTNVAGVTRHGAARGDRETGNVLNFAVRGIAGAQLVMALDVDGVAVSSGAACASGTLEPSHVLAAMPGADAKGGVRVSLGCETTAAQVERAVVIIEKVIARIRLPMY